MFKTFLKAAAVLFISFAGISCEKDSDSALSADSVQPGTMQVSVDGNQYSFSSSQLSSGWNVSSGSYSAEYAAGGGYPSVSVAAGNGVMTVVFRTSASDSATYMCFSAQDAYSISDGAVQSIVLGGDYSPEIGSGTLQNAVLKSVVYRK
jgi:hypothetical protein